MAWDKSRPVGSKKVRLCDDDLRENNRALEDALGREHIFPGVEGSTACIHKFQVVDADVPGYEGRLQIKNNILHWYANGAWRTLIPAESKMLFLQAAAPTGWTQDTELNDRVLRLVDGAGGGAGGDWAVSGVSVAGHVLTVEEIPAHAHGGGASSGPFFQYGSGAQQATSAASTGIAGGGLAHDHDLDIDGNWRPAYADVIACVKD